VGREALRSEEELLQLVRQRLAEAVSYRSRVVHNSDACRLVFSEADRLPGLIVDRYNDVFTLQVLTQAWAAPERKQAIIAGLKEIACAENIVERAMLAFANWNSCRRWNPGWFWAARVARLHDERR